MGLFSDLSAGFQEDKPLGNLFTSAAVTLAQRAGVNLGASSPEATKAPSVQGVPSQPVQPVYRNNGEWFKKPIVIIAAVLAVLGLLWALKRK